MQSLWMCCDIKILSDFKCNNNYSMHSIEYLKTLIWYYESTEEYERCEEIKQVIDAKQNS